MIASPYDRLDENERGKMSQLFDDVLPFYTRIAVQVPNKEFIQSHKEACVRLALAGKVTILSLEKISAEEAISSDDIFAQCIQYAWDNLLTDSDKLFLNDHLTDAAECFRMGFMWADLPDM